MMMRNQTKRIKTRITLDRKIRRRIKVTIAGFVFFFVLIFARSFQLQVIQHEKLASMAEQSQVTKVKLMKDRGAILDSTGEPLAVTIQTDSVFVRPKNVTDVEVTTKTIAKALDLDPSFIQRKLAGKAKFVWIKRQVPLDETEALKAANLPGVGTIKEAARSYPYGRLGASLLGVTGVDSQGLEGLELVYDQYLMGKPAAIEGQRDALGNLLFPAGIIFEGSEKGHALQLTIDAKIQFFADTATEESFRLTRAESVSAIVMDPKTGAILAMSNQPSFDPNIASAYRKNKAVTDAYEPGSTFKPFVVAAALSTGQVSLSDYINCENGSYSFGGHIIHDHNPHGMLRPEEIIKVSSNIGASKVAARMGAQSWYEAIRAFGFGEKSGIDFAGESAGQIRNYKSWRKIDIATSSFGQGVAVTPIQMASAFCALVNGGNLMKPYLLNKIQDSEGKMIVRSNPMIVRRVISEKTSREITRMLSLVTQEGGTARRAAITGYNVAGKTGTAQKPNFNTGGYYDNKVVASFIGAVPAGDPEIVVLVVIDDPKGSDNDRFGGVCAAPVFKKIAEQTLHYRRRFESGPLPIQPSKLHLRQTTQNQSEGVVASQGEFDENDMPNLVGLSVRRVLAMAQRRDLDLTIIGSGVAVRQTPEPGSKLDNTRHGTVLFRPAS